MDATQQSTAGKYIRLQETIAVTVNSGDRSIISDGDLVRGNADQFAIFLMGIVDGLEFTASTSLQKKPEVGPGSKTGCRDITETPFLKIGDNIVRGDQRHQKVGRIGCDKIGDHDDWRHIKR